MKYWREPLDKGRLKVPHGKVTVILDRCKGCEFCISYCSRGVLAMSSKFNRKGYHYPEAREPELCVNCRFCEVMCPEFAIFCEEVTE